LASAFTLSYLLLLFVEVVDDDTDEQVESEEGAKDDEDDEVDVHAEVDFARGLEVEGFTGVDGVVHDRHPALEGRHLKEAEVRLPHVVERLRRVHPSKVVRQAFRLVLDYPVGAESSSEKPWGALNVSEVVLCLPVVGYGVILWIHALVVLAVEELDAHDGEDEPEDEADEEDVEDGGDGLHEGVHDDTHSLHAGHGAEGPECAERPHRLECLDGTEAEHGGHEVDEGDHHDDKVQPAPCVREVANETQRQPLYQHLEEKYHRKDPAR
jgi:hypothetical protein